LEPQPQSIDPEKELLSTENKLLIEKLDTAENEIQYLKQEIVNIKETTVSKEQFFELRIDLKETIELAEDLFKDRKEQDEIISFHEIFRDAVKSAEMEAESQETLKRKRPIEFEDIQKKNKTLLVLPFPKCLPKPPSHWRDFILSTRDSKGMDNSCQTDGGYHQVLMKAINQKDKYAFSNELMHQQMKENLEKYEETLASENTKWKQMVDQTVATQKTMVSALQLSATRIQSLEATIVSLTAQKN